MNQTVNYMLLEDESITALALQRAIKKLRPNYRLLAASESALDMKALLVSPEVDLITRVRDN